MTRDATQGFDLAAAVCALLFLVCPYLTWLLGQPGVLPATESLNIFFVLYYQHEPFFLSALAVFALGTSLYVRRVVAHPADARPVVGTGSQIARQVVLIAVCIFALAAAGSSFVMHGLALSMDEYATEFQARIFATGRMTAPVPEAWAPFGDALTPVFVAYDRQRLEWASMYLPVYAALRTIAMRLDADRFLNPALAAVSVVLVHACGRRLWPNDKSRASIAVAFLALSSQFLFMSMTRFSMPAHLCFNLAWLYLYLRHDRVGWLAAPLIGVMAMGMHNAVPHVLFVTPFLFQLLLHRRWKWAMYFAAVYIIGAGLWRWWWQTQAGLADSTMLMVFALPGLFSMTVQTLSLSVLLTWQTPLLAVVLIWIVRDWRELSDTERCLAAGVLLSFMLFFFFPRPQGHGWGYRYTYATLGNLALLGATGVTLAARSIGAAARRLMITSAAATIVIQWPARAWQIERFIAPFARAHAEVAAIDADVVIVDPKALYYGADLVRNDPSMTHRPKLMNAHRLSPSQKAALIAQFGDRVHVLDAREIMRLGVPNAVSEFKTPVWFRSPFAR